MDVCFCTQASTFDDAVANLPRATEAERALGMLRRTGMRCCSPTPQTLAPGVYRYNARTLSPLRWSPPRPLRVALPSERPHLTRVEVKRWMEIAPMRWLALLAHEQRSLNIAVERAKPSTLAYYGCSLLRGGEHIEITRRGVVCDYVYELGYLQEHVIRSFGSARIEQHDFVHVDIALCDRSGYLVIGRCCNRHSAIELTAFCVPRNFGVLIPAKTVHSNDFLLGSWRTLLSAAKVFPSAQLVDASRQLVGLEI